MTEQNENETTEQLPSPSPDARIATLEGGFAAQQIMLKEISSKLDILITMQRDMYVDLRGRIVTLSDTVNQIQKDIQPDSFQNRLMRMG